MTAFFQTNLGLSYEVAWTLSTVVGILVIAFPLMLAVAMIIYADRKIWAAMALRRGPNVVGPFGLLQSFADGLKVFLQETIVPSSANRGLFLLAPIITFTVALIVWAVVPFSPGAVVADINVGLLYVLAASSIGVYGIIIAGWSSNSKYPFFSALRAAAQMVSYEVAIGFILISVVLWAGSFNLSAIVLGQTGHVLGVLNGFGFNPLLFPMAVVFLISSMAETQRAPFDLTEAESELVAGYQTEYSSMAFALFWLGEYANVILMCALNAILFWGGWLPPVDWAPLYVVPGILWLFAKILFFFFVFSWVKATVPRYRYDQLMRLGWKVFLPLSLVFVVLVSGYLMLVRYVPNQQRKEAETAEAMRRERIRQNSFAAFECTLMPDRGPIDANGGKLMMIRRIIPDPVLEVQWSVMQPGSRAVASVDEGYRQGTRIRWTAASGKTLRADIRSTGGLPERAVMSISDGIGDQVADCTALSEEAERKIGVI